LQVVIWSAPTPVTLQVSDQVYSASEERWIPFAINKLWIDPLRHIRDAACPAFNSGVPSPNVE